MTDPKPRDQRRFHWAAAVAAALAATAFVLALFSSDACRSDDASELGHDTGPSSDVPTSLPSSARVDVAGRDASPDAVPSATDTGEETDTSPDASLDTATESAGLDLSGRWVHRTVQTSLTKLPVGGEVTSKTLTYRIAEIRHEGESVSLQLDVCETSVENSSDRIETRIPDAFVESIPVSRRHATLQRRNGVAQLVASRTCSVRGADLAEPASTDLPTSPESPKVVDEDGDGHPGVTVEISGVVSGKLYIVQRGCDQFSGRILSDDRIRGTVDWSTEQKVLDSTSMLLGNKPPSRPHPDEEKSTFEMVRVDENTTCRELMDQPETYFKDER